MVGNCLNINAHIDKGKIAHLCGIFLDPPKLRLNLGTNGGVLCQDIPELLHRKVLVVTEQHGKSVERVFPIIAQIARLGEVLILYIKAKAQKSEPENEYGNLIFITQI